MIFIEKNERLFFQVALRRKAESLFSFIWFIFSFFVQMHASVGPLQFWKKNDNCARLGAQEKKNVTIWLPGIPGPCRNLVGQGRTLGVGRKQNRLKH